METQIPPHNHMVERAVLGSILRHNRALEDVVLIIRDETVFYAPSHKLIYRAFLDLFERSHPIDLVTVSSLLKERGQIDDVGGYVYVAELWEEVATGAKAEYYARDVYSLFQKRELLYAADEIRRCVYGSETGDEAVKEAEAKIFAVAEGAQAIRQAVSVDQCIKDVYEQIDRRASMGDAGIGGLRTGFVELDLKTAGLHKGEMVVIAARPGVGKTAMLLNVVRNAAVEESAKVLVVTLEMTRLEVAERLLAIQSGVDSFKMRFGGLSSSEHGRLVDAGGVLRPRRVDIDETPGQDALHILANARRMKRRHGLDLIVVDYLQLVEPEKTGRKFGNRQEEVSRISRRLKLVAKDVGVPVLVAAQLNRALESRLDKIPKLSDLRESGSIEADADMVIFMYETLPNANGAAPRDSVTFGIAKQRHGPTGEFSMFFDKKCVRFVEWPNVQVGVSA